MTPVYPWTSPELTPRPQTIKTFVGSEVPLETQGPRGISDLNRFTPRLLGEGKSTVGAYPWVPVGDGWTRKSSCFDKGRFHRRGHTSPLFTPERRAALGFLSAYRLPPRVSVPSEAK